MNTVTRFAPSPTGYLHVGGLRTALYNYLFGKQQQGEFILRIEDTDRTRLVEGAVEGILRTLDVMHLPIDRAPYVQSERLSIYRAHVDTLLANGHAYYCFCTKDRLDALREQQQALKEQTKYDRHCLHLTEEDVQGRLDRGEDHVVRLLVPEGKTTFSDEIRGEITIDNKEVDDQVLLKTDGFPTYHLAVVVDDNDMGVTHIIRGEEWISSVPKHVMLYRAFGFTLPKFAHLPLILNTDKSKLSKRQGDVAVEDYLAKGYLPEALLNFIALLGFNPTADREIYSLDELVALFDLRKINKSGAVFDMDKLNWMNGMYIRALSVDDLIERSVSFFEDSSVCRTEQFRRIATIEQDRLVTLRELVDRVGDYDVFDASVLTPALLTWKKSDVTDAKMHLQALISIIQEMPETDMQSRELIEACIRRYITDNGFDNGNVLWPLRAALSGKDRSPNPFELLWIFGKEESLRRIEIAFNSLH